MFHCQLWCYCDAFIITFFIALHALETNRFLLLFSCVISLPLRLCDSLPSAVPILPICSFTYPLLLFFLALGWWQSGIWVVCLLFHDMLCCVTAAAWPFSLPSSPSPPWKPTDFNVRVQDVLTYNCTMLIIMLNFLPTLFVTPLLPTWTPPSFSPTFIPLHAAPMAGLLGTGLLYTRRDCGFTCQSPGETLGVSWFLILYNCVATISPTQSKRVFFYFTCPLKETNWTVLTLQIQAFWCYQIMKSQCHLSAHSNVT